MKQDRHIHVAFVGNPNCGKTTLFNAVTGAKLKVANWPGVTVEKFEGNIEYEGYQIKLVDTPGIYSLSCYTIEEQVTRKCVMDDDIEAIVNVVDASSLERNLYLTLQLLELGKPVILALNMMDIVKERGMEIDLHRLPEMLGGIPVVPVSAAKRTGLDILLHAVVHHYEEGPKEDVMNYGPELEDKISRLEAMMQARYPSHAMTRWHAIKLLENDEQVTGEHPMEIGSVVDRSYENEIIRKKYQYIEEVVAETLFHKEKRAATTDRVDRLLTHPVWGVPVFLCIMALVFFLTFAVGDFLKGGFEVALGWVSEGARGLLTAVSASDWAISLVVDGVIAGVGGILTFLPNIFILFLALGILEDSGYMSRVAYVMDGIMGKVGLSGRAFLPMILGFGCTVPAIMASRALESKRDRYKVMLVTPFMSCSARLTIYILFAEMFFAEYAMLAAFSMYILGILVAIGVAAVLHLVDRKKSANYLLIELPEYKAPDARTVAIYVWEKVKDYLQKAGTTIFVATIIIWALLHFGPAGYVDGIDMEYSFAAYVGRALEGVFAPAGLNYWQIVVALIAGISAKEVVVTSCAVLFGVANTASAAGMGAFAAALAEIGFGPLNAVSLMVFCLLYIPCAATLATIHKESKSWAWTGLTALFQLLVAWVMATLVYQIGLLIV